VSQTCVRHSSCRSAEPDRTEHRRLVRSPDQQRITAAKCGALRCVRNERPPKTWGTASRILFHLAPSAPPWGPPGV